MLPSSILMVCTGNLCRSPFAAGYMQKCLAEAQADVECFSRGLVALPGHGAPETARQVALEFDVDLSGHVAQPLLGADLDRAGLVLVMERGHRQHAAKLRPASIGKVFLLSQPAGGETIEDPMGRSAETFRRVYSEITGHVENWMRRFGY